MDFKNPEYFKDLQTTLKVFFFFFFFLFFFCLNAMMDRGYMESRCIVTLSKTL